VSVTLDDQFVRDELGSAMRLRSLSGSMGFLHGDRAMEQKQIAQCAGAFKDHLRRQSLLRHNTVLSEQYLLRATLEILGRVLGLRWAVGDVEQLVRTDWISHVEIGKEKRYRDHVTHSVRVAAIGWWLLHRNRGRLLASLAREYKSATLAYCQEESIDVSGWWVCDGRANGNSDVMAEQVAWDSNGADLISAPSSLLPWMSMVEYAWLATGLLHDLAYPLQRHLRACCAHGGRYREWSSILGPALGRFGSPVKVGSILDSVRGSWMVERLPDLEERLARCFRGRGDGLAHSHAILGALNPLLRTPIRLASVEGLVLQMAGRAIATHHDDENQHICADGLAKLLFVADSLHMWERPFLHTANKAFQRLVECQKIALEPDGRCYMARFIMNSQKKDLLILKEAPYEWKYKRFIEPLQRVQNVLRDDRHLPNVTLCRCRCIRPRSYYEFMNK
jgi:hypothetical protein